jgi:electron transfer flavoprotein beta subunit
MHIVVLAKVVPDYEVPLKDFELSGNRAHERYTRMIGLYDENAIETGVQLKEAMGAHLSVVSYGQEADVSYLRKAVAMGADELILVTGDSDDAMVIAGNLKMAVESIGPVDLVLAGQQSADMDRGIVHGLLAEMLGVPFIPQVSKIQLQNDTWIVNQITKTADRELSFSGKGVLSITSIPENVPRIPQVRSIFAAKKKPAKKLAAIAAPQMELKELSVTIPTTDSVCEILPLDDLEGTARALLMKLREERYL